MTGSSWSSFWSSSAREEAKRAAQAEAVANLRGLLNSQEGRIMAKQLVQGGELQEEPELTSDAYLKRWLVARNWDVHTTFKLLQHHAAWRVRMSPKGYIDKDGVAAQLAERKVFVQGVDKQGRSLLIVSVKHHTTGKTDMTELKRFVCFCIDALVAVCDPELNPQRKGVVVFDLTDAGMANMDVVALKMIINLLNTQYVERLGVMYFYNPPYIFWGIWHAMKALLPDATREKIVMVDPSDTSVLRNSCSPEVLPACYGGQAELLPVEEALAKFGALPAGSQAWTQAMATHDTGTKQMLETEPVIVAAG